MGESLCGTLPSECSDPFLASDQRQIDLMRSLCKQHDLREVCRRETQFATHVVPGGLRRRRAKRTYRFTEDGPRSANATAIPQAQRFVLQADYICVAAVHGDRDRLPELIHFAEAIRGQLKRPVGIHQPGDCAAELFGR